MNLPRSTTDRKLLLYLTGGTLLLILGIILLAPTEQSNDPVPSVTNHGPAGAKGLLLSLQSLGYHAARYDGTLDDLKSVDAANTTLLLAAPHYPATEQKQNAASLLRFLQRGGRVLATGDEGALLLPGGSTAQPAKFQSGLCYTTPEGPGPLAATGPAEIYDFARWNGDDLSVRVDHRCNNDAVVVHFPVGSGTAIWWSSAHPLTNAGLKSDPNLRLLLASLGGRKNILFDEALHAPIASKWGKLDGLPTWSLLLQFLIVFLLLVLSYGRRRGPIRTLVTRPRTSPLEFAESMGTLYARGGATSAATDAALARLHRTLRLEAGLSPTVIAASPESIAATLTSRLGGDWSGLALELQQAQQATLDNLNPRSALALVRALHTNEATVRAALKPTLTQPSPT
jgi:hypothetical protein